MYGQAHTLLPHQQLRGTDQKPHTWTDSGQKPGRGTKLGLNPAQANRVSRNGRDSISCFVECRRERCASD
jgi:hypothetical protein